MRVQTPRADEPRPSTRPDADLVRRAAEGDKRAFAQLVRSHEGRVRSLLLRLTRGNRVLADDLAQETFLRAYRGLSGFEGRARFSTWIHRIAYYVYLNHRNRSKTLAALPEEFENTAAAPDDETSAARSDLRRDLSLLVSTLPRHYREVVVMHFMRHVPYRDIADTLGMPLGTVKTQLHRAKAMMRQRLQVWDGMTAAAA